MLLLNRTKPSTSNDLYHSIGSCTAMGLASDGASISMPRQSASWSQVNVVSARRINAGRRSRMRSLPFAARWTNA